MNGQPYTMSVDMACMVLRVKFDLIWLKEIKPETKERYGHHSVIVDKDSVTTEVWREAGAYGLYMAEQI